MPDINNFRDGLGRNILVQIDAGDFSAQGRRQRLNNERHAFQCPYLLAASSLFIASMSSRGTDSVRLTIASIS